MPKLTVMGSMWEFVRLKLPTSAPSMDYDTKVWTPTPSGYSVKEVYDCSTEDDNCTVTCRPFMGASLEHRACGL